MIETIIQLGKRLNMTIVAEGIELEEEATLLEQMGCHTLQGYLFYRPLQPQQLEYFLAMCREG